jgi:predicted Rossmann fold nucleotide-binding protein DprA/Smf involved in DNA uptake
MQRNKLIYSLADAALVVGSGLNKGGTWAGAVEQLDKLRLLPFMYAAQVKQKKAGSAGKRRITLAKPQDVDSFDAVFDVSLAIFMLPTSNHSLFVRESAPHINQKIQMKLPAFRQATVRPPLRSWQRNRKSVGNLVAEVRKLLTQHEMPYERYQVATELQVSMLRPKWLRRLLEEGVVEKRSKPISYVVKQASLFEQGTPTDDV